MIVLYIIILFVFFLFLLMLLLTFTLICLIDYVQNEGIQSSSSVTILNTFLLGSFDFQSDNCMLLQNRTNSIMDLKLYVSWDKKKIISLNQYMLKTAEHLPYWPGTMNRWTNFVECILRSHRTTPNLVYSFVH